ncbi:TetR family transcriptional regulator [Crossiella sp. CA-258035]|uniref:TetR/AcrR family transcriptional regulator n=1 Tax=Crossiella sp. CA-258035 TaxID=2981138 RepID=UPI0024BD3F47|nr:TetR family transcriptional regulator [Crossiella sp. CA-258035]WHT17799.1 TetR family transcriptional regulator [Crossiella sp. CA-258035]
MGDDVPVAESTAPRRRGRRPAGEDTKGALLSAARAVFTEQGYDGATVRMIAARAQVDPAMVNHWFGGKESLFAAAVQLPVTPQQILETVLAGPVEGLGERIVRRFLSVWDETGGGPFVALMRSASSHDDAAGMLREFVTHALFGKIARAIEADQPDLRASLVGAQVAGLGMMRYVIKLEPLASADHDTLAAAVAPTLQRYLTGDLA